MRMCLPWPPRDARCPPSPISALVMRWRVPPPPRLESAPLSLAHLHMHSTSSTLSSHTAAGCSSEANAPAPSCKVLPCPSPHGADDMLYARMLRWLLVAPASECSRPRCWRSCVIHDIFCSIPPHPPGLLEGGECGADFASSCHVLVKACGGEAAAACLAIIQRRMASVPANSLADGLAALIPCAPALLPLLTSKYSAMLDAVAAGKCTPCLCRVFGPFTSGFPSLTPPVACEENGNLPALSWFLCR